MNGGQIAVDLDVYKAIEAKRLSFDEPHNAILRRVLGLGSKPNSLRSDDRVRASRRGGEYELQIFGETVAVSSLKEVVRTALLKIEERKPGFIANTLARHQTPRGRRIVALTADEIYPGNPQLVRHAERLNSKWWFDTNISRRACQRYLTTMSILADIDPPILLD